MKFSTTEELAAPIERVFSELSDFGRFEREAIKNGVELRRKDSLTEPGTGMGWKAGFIARGKPRELDAEVTEFDRPDRIGFAGQVGGMSGVLVIDLRAVSAEVTAMDVTLDLKPKSFSARVLVQSMRLARGTIAKRFRKAVRKYSRRMERRIAKDHG